MTPRWMMLGMAGLVAIQLRAQAPPTLATDKERKSYAVGADLAKNLQRSGMTFEIDALLKGMHDVLTAAQPLLSETELREALNAFQTEVKLMRARPMKMVADVNRTEGEAFLNQNKTKAGVVALSSGLQYKVLTAGNGRKPGPEDVVECHLLGKLLSGAEFENTYHRGQPAALKLQTVIPGMREALLNMPVGSKWQLFVPPALAYGEKGAGSSIEPYSTLTFELELLAIK